MYMCNLFPAHQNISSNNVEQFMEHTQNTENVYLNSSAFLVHVHKYEPTVPVCCLLASHCPPPPPILPVTKVTLIMLLKRLCISTWPCL